MMWKNHSSLCRRTTLCQKLPRDFVEKLVTFQQQVTGLHEINEYTVSKTGNADEVPVYINTPPN